jgi:hypothetical protein
MKHLLRKLIKEAIKEISTEKPEKKNIYYVGVILDENSQNLLRNNLHKQTFSDVWSDTQIGSHGHKQLNHHMTIAANSAEKSGIQNLGEKIKLQITGFGIDENLGVAAWRVVSPIPIKSGVPHITALLKDGVKPFLAGKIKEWKDINPFTIEGTICEALDNGETNPPIL